MPTYIYEREDGTRFEAKQPITDDPLEKCPETGQPCRRVIPSPPSVQFNGGGFHVNDYSSENPGVTGGRTDSEKSK
jgi:putative FmdB family regulatory protein